LITTKLIEEYWDTFDKDGEMKLDLNDTKQFVKDCEQEMMDGTAGEFMDQDFAITFNRFDEDGSGYIKKE
jgi:Ca2+-binding EF-hand superfamily protein